MSKLYIVYGLAALCLFGALFAAFAMAGLGSAGPLDVSGEGDVPVATAEAAAGTPQPESSPPSPLKHLDYPDLEHGRTYRVSHQTSIYLAPDVEEADMESLPAGGYFGVQARERKDDELWYRVTVSDGVRDYIMYLPAAELNFKTVTPLYNADEQQAQEREEALRRVREAFARSASRDATASGQATAEPEPQPQTFSDWWSGVVQQVGGATTANLIVAGLAAFVLTLLTLGSIFLAVWLRRTYAWQRPAADLEDDELGRGGEERGSEFYEHDAPGESSGGENLF